VTDYLSWGRHFKYGHRVFVPSSASRVQEILTEKSEDSRKPILAYGSGRSYGDCCLNDGGSLVDMRALDRILFFDTQTGIIRCEPGVTLSVVMEKAVPHGWVLPVIPSSGFVTIAGALCGDVHGRNHPTSGTFGGHVRSLRLIRSDSARAIRCSMDENRDLFRATVGGLGMTGLVVELELQLTRVPSGFLRVSHESFEGVDSLLRMHGNRNSEFRTFWVDALTLSKRFCGIVVYGDWTKEIGVEEKPGLARFFPPVVPFRVVNRLTVRALNTVYRKLAPSEKAHIMHYRSFFYQLDSVPHWNRYLGRSGFLQYQFVLPEKKTDRLSCMLDEIAKSSETVFLMILKSFGSARSPGILSFPMRGLAGAFDFVFRGESTRALFRRLDSIVREAGGRLNPVKDSLMTPADFKNDYPGWREVESLRDPRISSSFWRRVACAI
jgi:FAD/FMN-containing dehydrogenase